MIEEINDIEDLHKFIHELFNIVLNGKYNSLQNLHNYTSLLYKVLDTIKYHLSLNRFYEADILGATYERILLNKYKSYKYIRGIYRTPPLVSLFISHIVRETINEKKNIKILDPAFGSGQLILYLVHFCNVPVTNVYGVEIDEINRLLGILNLILYELFRNSGIYYTDVYELYRTLNNNIILGDYFDYFTSLPPFDLIICNPPFTRIQYIPPKYRHRLMQILQCKIPQGIGLYGLYMLASLVNLKSDGIAIFITPNYIYTKSGKELIKTLYELGVFIQEIIIITREESNSDLSSKTSIAITILNKDSNPVRRTILRIIPSSKLVKLLEDCMHGEDNGSCLLNSIIDTISSKMMFNEGFTHDLNAMIISQSAYMHNLLGVSSNEEYLTLSDVAIIRRGIATGALNYLVLGTEEMHRLGIDEKYLLPVLVNARYVKGFIFTKEDFERISSSGRKCWLINVRIRNELPDNITQYLDSLRKILTKNKLDFTLYPPAEIIVPCFMYRRARFIYNEAKVYALNAFQLIYIKNKDLEYIKAIAAYLNSSYIQEILRAISVKYSERLYKIEPRHLKALPIPKLNDELIKELARLFEKLKDSDRNKQQIVLNEIDEVVKYKINLNLKSQFETN